MLLSIIIPVYNGEKTILRCLYSIFRTFKNCKNNIQVIVVNDGSNDRTVENIWKADFEGIRVISKLNGGVSSARNEGIKVATGDYIWFVDSDDYLLNFKGERILEILKDNTIDMLLFGFQKNIAQNKIKLVCNKRNLILQHNMFIKKFSNIFCENEFNVPWNRIVKRSIITEHQIQFNPQIKVGEDAIFNCKVVPYLHKVVVLNWPLYVYNLYYSKESKLYMSFLKSNLSKLNLSLEKMVKREKIDEAFLWNEYERINYTLLINDVKKYHNYKEFKENIRHDLLPVKKINFQKLNFKSKIYYLLNKFNSISYFFIKSRD